MLSSVRPAQGVGIARGGAMWAAARLPVAAGAAVGRRTAATARVAPAHASSVKPLLRDPAAPRRPTPAAPGAPCAAPHHAARHAARPGVAARAAAGALAAPGDGDSAPAAPPALFLKKVAGLGIIFLCATVNYTILQSLRDAIIVTSCGAEALPFINGFCVLPASLAFFVYYDALVTRFEGTNPGAVFYWAIAPLAAFFAFFALALLPNLPNVDALHPTWLLAKLGSLPDSIGCLVKLVANWTYTLFFVLGELWGSVAISLLFWSLADDICSVDEAKSLYPKLGIAANVGLVVAGRFTRLVNDRLACGDAVLSMQILCGAVAVMAGILCGAVAVMAGVMCAAKFFVRPYLAASGAPSKKDAKKAKKADAAAAAAGEPAEARKPDTWAVLKSSSKIRDIALMARKPDTWAVLKSSSKLRDISLMVMGFGICNKVFGWTWKSEMRKLYPSATEYTSIMGDVAGYTGTVTIILMAISKWTFQLLKWKGAALATPVVMGLCGGIFFVGSVMGQAAGASTAVGLTAMMVAAGPLFGIINQVFGRASKYSLFDPCKEMLFITMADKREKESGKAAVDIVGNQVGKSGGAWVMQGLILVSGSMSKAMPLTCVFFFGIISVWVGAALRLARTMAPEEHAAVTREHAAVTRTVDESPSLEPPLPQKVAPPARVKAPPPPAAAAADGGAAGAAAAAGALAAVAAGAPVAVAAGDMMVDIEYHDHEDGEVKSALQSHFD
ncbi:MAG: TLC ATP/ADP transporter-domain-containing protein [Monoraphidium minutum]|nr:MAG: TLC ATP/ADP transporter-domain-containing protein [Monoraphidium minutum]